MINFVRARAAGVLSRQVGAQVSTAAAPAVPDFAFETDRRQQTLSRALLNGPVLIALFGGPPPAGRLAQLAGAQGQLAAAGLRVVAVDLHPPPAASETAASSPLVGVAGDVAAMLALFPAPGETGETDLMLDRAGNIRARWSAAGSSGLPDTAALVADAARVARFAAAPENHAGHAP